MKKEEIGIGGEDRGEGGGGKKKEEEEEPTQDNYHNTFEAPWASDFIKYFIYTGSHNSQENTMGQAVTYQQLGNDS